MSQTTTATTVDAETWLNTQAAEVWITKLLEKGPTPTRIKGGKEFRVTAAEREYHQNDCVNDAADPYQNGHLRQTGGEPYVPPVRETKKAKSAPAPAALTMADIDMSDPATAIEQFRQLQSQQLDQFAAALGVAGEATVTLTDDEIAQVPEMGPNPNQLRDDEVTWLLTCPDTRLVGWRLDQIDSEVALQGLLAGAREVSPVPRQEELAKRILAINPKAATLPGNLRVPDDNTVRPRLVDMEKLHVRPQTGDVAELAPGAPRPEDTVASAADGSLMVEAPPAGAPAPEPLPPHLKAFHDAAH